MGTSELFDFLRKYDITLSTDYSGTLGKHTKKPFNKFVTEENKKLVSDEALDLLSKMLIYDPVIIFFV